MKLIGNLKDKVENAEDKEQAKGLIAEAGMELTDDELNIVTGGVAYPSSEMYTDGNVSYD
jgi:hypothetical protein